MSRGKTGSSQASIVQPVAATAVTGSFLGPASHAGGLKLQDLMCFITVAGAAGIRRAASQLGVQQSVVSRRILDLEDELGVSLFERRSTGVRLTQVGRAFLVDAQRIVADVERARRSLEKVALGTAGRLRLATCEDATTALLAKILAAHRRQFPAVALELFEMPSAAQASALRRGDIDAGILLPPVHDDGLQIDEVWREPWAIAVPSGHALAAAESITIADVAQFGIIIAHPELGPGCYDQSRRLFTSAGLEPRVVVHAFHRQTTLMLVQSGAGVTIVPGSFIGFVVDGIEFRPLLTDSAKMVVSAAFPEGDISGLVAQFLRVARAAVSP